MWSSGDLFLFNTGNDPNGAKSSNLMEKKNKVVQFGPEFDLNIQVQQMSKFYMKLSFT